MAREWTTIVNDMSPVQKLVHLAMRYTAEDSERIRAELVRARKRAYEDELTMQAARVGCPGRRGSLQGGQSLTQLNDMSKADAESIMSSYNYDLAGAVSNIAAETPSANRNTYAKRLDAWDNKRNGWKISQIAQYAEGSARSLAQQDFYRLNSIQGMAELRPVSAVCPVCKGWVARGKVKMEVALNNPPPYHPNCPHLFRTDPGRVPPDECRLLWMGG